eukprot:4610644-Prymnesium_polylepis.1
MAVASRAAFCPPPLRSASTVFLSLALDSISLYDARSLSSAAFTSSSPSALPRAIACCSAAWSISSRGISEALDNASRAARACC